HQAALVAAKRRGVNLGGPRLAAARRASIEAREIADAFATNVRPVIKEKQGSGVTSMRGLARALAARGVKTAQGGDWGDVQVPSPGHLSIAGGRRLGHPPSICAFGVARLLLGLGDGFLNEVWPPTPTGTLDNRSEQDNIRRACCQKEQYKRA